MIVIINRGSVGEIMNPGEPESYGAFLTKFDPEFGGGVGAAYWSYDPQEAMRLPTMVDAWALWRTQPKCRPLREDGKPNRPLTAYNIEFKTVEES